MEVLKQLNGYDISARGVVHLKGKGDIVTYWVNDKANLIEEIRPLPPLPLPSEIAFTMHPFFNRTPNGSPSRSPTNSLHHIPEERPHRRISTILKRQINRHGSLCNKRHGSDSGGTHGLSNFILARRGSGSTVSREKQLSVLPRIPDETTRPLLENYINGFLPHGRIKTSDTENDRHAHSTPTSRKNTALDLCELDERSFNMADLVRTPLLKFSGAKSVQNLSNRKDSDRPNDDSRNGQNCILPNSQVVAQAVF